MERYSIYMKSAQKTVRKLSYNQMWFFFIIVFFEHARSPSLEQKELFYHQMIELYSENNPYKKNQACVTFL